MSYYTLAISSSNHDSSICLLEDDRIVLFVPCERLSRKKHTQDISEQDLRVIANYTNEVDKVILVNVYSRSEDPNTHKKEVYNNAFTASAKVGTIKQKLKRAGIDFKKIVVDNGNHHLYHAATGFYCSGFDEALCLVIDGVGSSWTWQESFVSLSETTSIIYMTQDYSKTLYKNLYYKLAGPALMGWSDSQIANARKSFKHNVDISQHIDIGKMYGTIARHVGFKSALEAGKVMGLAGYGEPNNLPPMLIGDSTISDANVFKNDSQLNTFLYPQLSNPSDEVKRNLAYNVQKALEKIFVARVQQALELKPCKNLVLGGGCALNIIGNSVIKQKFPELNIYVEPIAADTSQSLGAALYHYKREFPLTKFKMLKDLYLGPEYSIMDTKQKLQKLVEQYNNEPSL